MNMKKTKSILMPCLLLMGMVTVASCSNDNEEWMQENIDNVLKVETCIADTRAVVKGTEFKEGDKIGVYTIYSKGGIIIGGGTNATPDNSANIAAQYRGTAWQFDENIKLYNQSADVYAYYPYRAETRSIAQPIQDIPAINIDITPDAENGQTDYMYGVSNTAVNINNSIANIQFKHALARITLSILKGTNDVGKGVISKVCLKNNTKVQTISTTGTMKLTGGITYDSNIDATITLSTNFTVNEKKAQDIDLLVFPATGKRGTELVTNVTESVEIVLTIDGANYSIPLSGMIWQAGKQYTYPITINRNTLIKPTVTPGEKVYMGFNGDNGKPLYWSSYNLGAKSPEEYGGLYGWADPTGEKTSTDLDDYPSANPPTDISGTEYNIARQMWGDNWRLPTSREWSKLAQNCKYVWTTYNGVKGCKITSKINNNSIFLPYSPSRSGNTISWSEWNTVSGTFHQSSLYWSSTLNSEAVEHATCFYFDNDSNVWNAKGGKRYGGYPIRPVME